jgi:hypothetical protein
MARWTIRALAAIAAFGVSIVSVLGGFAFRFALQTRWPIEPYRCYDWVPIVDKILVAYVIVTPLVAASVWEKRRTLSLVAIGIGAFILATFAWSFTSTTFCAPL